MRALHNSRDDWLAVSVPAAGKKGPAWASACRSCEDFQPIGDPEQAAEC